MSVIQAIKTGAAQRRTIIDVTRELGFVKNKIDVKKYSDLSLVQEAAKRLQ